jgi:hypothetical protein
MGRVRPAIIWLAASVFLIAGSVFVYYRAVIAGVVEQGRVSSTRALLSHLEQLLSMYREDHDRYPKSLEELMTEERRHFELRGNGAVDTKFVDSWGHPLIYREISVDPLRPRSAYSLYSVGPNGIEEGGGGDDVMPD